MQNCAREERRDEKAQHQRGKRIERDGTVD